MNRLPHFRLSRPVSRFGAAAVLSMVLFGVASVASAAGQGGVPEGEPDPALLQALEKKKQEAERLRQRVKELEALLRMKSEISDAKSRAIEQLEAARKMRGKGSRPRQP